MGVKAGGRGGQHGGIIRKGRGRYEDRGSTGNLQGAD